MDTVCFRQIHLDFHTSPEIPGIGEEFDAEQFALTLRDASVNSVNVFAKCHHGMYYYPTRVGTMHPGLSFDLLGAQLKALKRHGIRALAYTCVAWNEDWADRHPEWLQVSPEGVLGHKRPFSAGYNEWRYLCLNNRAHREYIKTELTEIHNRYAGEGLAGFWVDIILSRRCVCPSCRADMKRLGLNPENELDLARHDRLNETSFMTEVFAHIKSLDPGLAAYFNGHPYESDLRDDPATTAARKREVMSFIDIESLPSDAWGYAHFPVNVNYLNKYAQELTMMNGKFHLSWGDMGSLRNLEALEYECFRGLANGTKVCIGDQMHPCGRLDKSVYERLGQVLGSVREKEPWCAGTEKVAEVGVYLTRRAAGLPVNPIADATLEGAYRMLTELRVPFDFVDFLDPLDQYRVVILPEGLRLPEEAAKRIDAFVARGGRVLAAGDGGLNEEGSGFAVQSFCARYESAAEYCPRYVRIGEGLIPGVPPMDYVLYDEGQKVSAANGARVLACAVNPYFNRTWEHFSSHRQTPPCSLTDEPALLANGNTAYVSAAIFSGYAVNGYKLYKQILDRLLDELYPDRLVYAGLPSTAELTLRKQGDHIVLHVLNYVVQRKCKKLDTVEDRWKLNNAPVRLRVPAQPSSVLSLPRKDEIPYRYEGGYVAFEIPEVNGHQMVLVKMQKS